MSKSPEYYPYIHIAVVIVLDGIPYAYQVSQFDKDIHNYSKEDTRISNPLLIHPVLLNMDHIEYYKGHVHHFAYKGSDISEQTSRNIIEKNKDDELSVYTYFSNLHNKKYINDKKHLCCTFSAKTIEQLNIHKFDNYYNVTQGTFFNEVVMSGNMYEKTPSIINNYYMNYHQ